MDFGVVIVFLSQSERLRLRNRVSVSDRGELAGHLEPADRYILLLTLVVLYHPGEVEPQRVSILAHQVLDLEVKLRFLGAVERLALGEVLELDLDRLIHIINAEVEGLLELEGLLLNIVILWKILGCLDQGHTLCDVSLEGGLLGLLESISLNLGPSPHLSALATQGHVGVLEVELIAVLVDDELVDGELEGASEPSLGFSWLFAVLITF